MSESSLQAQGGLENQPVMPVRRLNNFVFCPRLFYFQWVENIFQESADTVAGSNVHRNVDASSRLDDEKVEALSENLPEGARRGRRVSRFHHPLNSTPNHHAKVRAIPCELRPQAASLCGRRELMQKSARFLVSYDISHPKCLRRVAKAMEGFGGACNTPCSSACSTPCGWRSARPRCKRSSTATRIRCCSSRSGRRRTTPA